MTEYRTKYTNIDFYPDKDRTVGNPSAWASISFAWRKDEPSVRTLFWDAYGEKVLDAARNELSGFIERSDKHVTMQYGGIIVNKMGNNPKHILERLIVIVKYFEEEFDKEKKL